MLGSPSVAGQPGIQVGQQLLPARQQRRARRQRHRPARHLRLLVDQLADADAAPVSEDPAWRYVANEPGSGWPPPDPAR